MGVWGRSTQPLGNFLYVFGKNGYFNAIWITFRKFSKPFKRTKFLKFESQLNKFLPLSSGQVQNTLKILHHLAWSGESGYIAFCNIFSIKSFTRRFAFEDFSFVMKITSFRNMYDPEPKHPRFNFNNLLNKHFPLVSFFKSILSHEN